MQQTDIDLCWWRINEGGEICECVLFFYVPIQCKKKRCIVRYQYQSDVICSLKKEVLCLMSYVFKYNCKTHISDSDMANDMINFPPPKNLDCVPVLDAWMKKALTDEGKNTAREQDSELHTIQKKFFNVMSPRGQLGLLSNCIGPIKRRRMKKKTRRTRPMLYRVSTIFASSTKKQSSWWAMASIGCHGSEGYTSSPVLG